MSSVLYLLACFAAATASNMCSSSNIDLVARIVFGEAADQPYVNQLAVAYTLVNRVSHSGYPNTLHEVVFQNNGSHYQYKTLDEPSHDIAWESAKAISSAEYQIALQAAENALCKRQSDPTSCATDFCVYDPCSATSSNRFYEVYHKKQIGKHYFVCRRPVLK